MSYYPPSIRPNGFIETKKKPKKNTKMANMKYCKFRNTLNNLKDCIDDINERLDNLSLDSNGNELSLDEFNAMEEMIDVALAYKKIAYYFTINQIELTCCGDEISKEVRDIGICPTCLEHI